MGFIAAALAPKTRYDVIVVGSGAAGGQTAYTLAMEGARVLMLEAGRRYAPETETPMFQTPHQAPLRGSGTADKPFGFHDATVDGGWQVPGEPYVNASEDRSCRFDWWRARMLGGRTQNILRAAMDSRAACFWATPCGRGCSVGANYQSTTVHLPPALATGKLDIVTDAMVREVMLDQRRLASGVRFIDKTTGKDCEAQARVVVLAAGACETVRILLNSKSPAFSHGLGNSSGKVGRYLMDTVGSDVEGQVPLLESLPPHNEDGASGDHMYAPWWLYQEQLAGKLGFARGYHIEFYGGRRMPSIGTAAGLEWLTGGSYGAKFKADVRRYYGSAVYFSGRGEMIPNDDCYCEIDPQVRDKWGIPVLRFHWKWSEHETRQAAHMQQTFAGIIDAMGGRVKGEVIADGSKAIAPGGSIIHEVGGAIMGADAGRSVTNRWGQSWDVGNLFITDGAVFASNADKNPTLTIMALAWRGADRILELMRRKEL